MLLKSLKLIQLVSSFRKSQQTLDNLRKEKLKETISYTFENVEYFKRLFNKFEPEIFEASLNGDLSKIPIIDKRTFRQYPREDFISKKFDPGKCISVRTSGATGIPFEMLKSSYESKFMELIFTRAMFLSGCRPFDSQITICCPYDFHKSHNLISLFKLKNKICVSAFLTPNKLVDEINHIKPKILRAYASTLTLLSRFIRKKNLKIHSPKLIISGSDLLTKDQHIEIEEVMKSSVVDFYGTVETGNIAFQCKKCGDYHINSDFLDVEFLDEDKPVKNGESGMIIVTSLFHRVKPLIKYAIGDRGEPSYSNKCSLTNMKSMKNIEGRIVDFLILPDDREVSPYALTDTIKSVNGVEEFKAIQETKNDLLVQVITKEENRSLISSNVIKKIQAILGDEIKIKVEFIDSIIRYPGQKFRVVTSCVPR
jgi:phenylacetate-CoA ligase